MFLFDPMMAVYTSNVVPLPHQNIALVDQLHISPGAIILQSLYGVTMSS